PGGATPGGTLTVTAQRGVATFSDLTLNKGGTRYTLPVTANGLGAATTHPIGGAPATGSQLLLTRHPPTRIVAGSGFGVVATAYDPFDNVATSFSGSVAIAILNNPGGATLGGTLTVTAQSGVATFSGLTLNKVGTGYTLQVSTSGLTAATTNPLSVRSGEARKLGLAGAPAMTGR